MSVKLKDNQFFDKAGNLCTKLKNGRLRVTTLNLDPSRTIQSERDSVDIHKILARFEKTGVMGNIRESGALFDDFTTALDYHSSLNRILDADEAFMSLPSQLRKRFDNDPGNLLTFLDDPKNRDEAISLGLLDESQAKVIQSRGDAQNASEGNSEGETDGQNPVTD